MPAGRTLGFLAAIVLFLPAASAALSQSLSANTSSPSPANSPVVVASSPGGNVTAVAGPRLAVVGIAPHRPDAYSDLPASAESFGLVGHQSFSWVFLARVGDRAGADLTVANYGARSTTAIITCNASDGLNFAALETPGYGPGAVMYLGGNSYGMLLPGGAQGNFTLIYVSDAPGQHASTCTLSEGS